MPSAQEDSPRHSHAQPDEPAADDPGSVAARVWSKLRFLSFKKDGDARHEHAWILASVISLSLLAVLAIWLALSAYAFLSQHFAAKTAEMKPQPQAATERPVNGNLEYERAKRDAQRALKEAERQRQINVAKMQADKYEWTTWLHTLRDIDDNNKRLEEKQRAAEKQAEEAQRLALIAEQKKAQEAQRRAAEAEAAAAPAAPVRKKKKTMRTFD